MRNLSTLIIAPITLAVSMTLVIMSPMGTWWLYHLLVRTLEIPLADDSRMLVAMSALLLGVFMLGGGAAVGAIVVRELIAMSAKKASP